MAVSPRGSEGSATNTTKQIREWAVGEGLEVSSRGRISAEIEQAFHAAQAKNARAKPAPGRKTAVKKTAVKKTAAEKPAATKSAVKKTVVKKQITAKAPATGAAASTVPAKKSSGEIREWGDRGGLGGVPPWPDFGRHRTSLPRRSREEGSG